MSSLSSKSSYFSSLSPWPCLPAITAEHRESRQDIVSRHSIYNLKEKRPQSTAHQYQRLLGVRSALSYSGLYLVSGRPRSPYLGPLSGEYAVTRKSKKRNKWIRKSWEIAPARRRPLNNDNVLKYLCDLNMRPPRDLCLKFPVVFSKCIQWVRNDW